MTKTKNKLPGNFDQALIYGVSGGVCFASLLLCCLRDSANGYWTLPGFVEPFGLPVLLLASMLFGFVSLYNLAVGFGRWAWKRARTARR